MKIRNKKYFSISILMILFLLVMVGCNDAEVSDNAEISDETVIAEYDGGEVTQAEFDAYMGVAKFFQSDINEYLATVDEEGKNKILQAYLESFVGEKYLDGQIDKSKDAEDEANKTLQSIKEQSITEFGSEDAYNDVLDELNITEDDVYNYLNRYYNIENYFVEKEYKENQAEFTVASVRHILIGVSEDVTNEDGSITPGRSDEDAKEIGNEVLSKLDEGEDFGDLAKEYSEDPGSKDNGGLYEDFPIAGFVVEFKESIKELEANEISGLVKTDYGYHIITVLNKTIPTLEEIDEDTRYVIFTNAYNNFYESELQSIIININL